MDWNGTWQRITGLLREPEVDQAALADALRTARARAPVPVLWLLGKTQAGKTSIIRALTGSDSAEIGNGFQPCTRSARCYDFPAGMPVLRFLDTRGLGERAYDPGEDIAFCDSSAHLVVAVVKIADPAQEAVFDVVRAVRRRHPDWPVLLVHTGLHELYPPGMGHPLPYPFDCEDVSARSAWPAELARATQVRGSPADRAGILPGDVLTGMDGRPVRSASEMLAMVAAIAPGKESHFSIRRGNNALDVTVAVGRRPVPGNR